MLKSSKREHRSTGSACLGTLRYSYGIELKLHDCVDKHVLQCNGQCPHMTINIWHPGCGATPTACRKPHLSFEVCPSASPTVWMAGPAACWAK